MPCRYRGRLVNIWLCDNNIIMSHSIRFYDNLIPAILSGDKTITIRSASGYRYKPGSRLDVLRDSNGERVAEIEITAVEAICFQDLNESHAEREAMSLTALKKLIAEIYPGIDHLTVISFKLIQ